MIPILIRQRRPNKVADLPGESRDRTICAACRLRHGMSPEEFVLMRDTSFAPATSVVVLTASADFAQRGGVAPVDNRFPDVVEDHLLALG